MSPEDEARVRQLIREVMDEDAGTRRPFGNRGPGRDTMQVIAEHVARTSDTASPAVIAEHETRN
jgi:hypothetical protein